MLPLLPLPLLPECKSRRDKKRQRADRQQTVHPKRGVRFESARSANIIRESTPEKLASLASMKGEGKKRRVRVCAFHHRDELIDRHPRFFEPRSSPPPSLPFRFLLVSFSCEFQLWLKEFFLPLRVAAFTLEVSL